MPTFIVGVKEVHVQEVVIEAESEEDAIFMVENGEGENGKCEYDYTLDSDEWVILEVNAE